MNYIEVDTITNKVLAGPFEGLDLPVFSEDSNITPKNADVITGTIYAGGIFDQNSNTVSPPAALPFPSWVWSEKRLVWHSATEYPTVTEEDIKSYTWNEETQTWDLVEE